MMLFLRTKTLDNEEKKNKENFEKGLSKSCLKTLYVYFIGPAILSRMRTLEPFFPYL